MTIRYAMCPKMWEDDTSPEARFTFEAASIDDAGNKARSWAHYHGMSFSQVIVREAEGDEIDWTPRNEYVS